MFSKKIALFISHIYGEYQRNVSQGIIDKALEYGYQTEIYTTNDGEELGGLSKTEECIFRLPVYSNLNGVVFASGTYSSMDFREKITNTLKESGIPVIEINDTDPVFTNVSMDNSTMIAAIIDHFVSMHNAKRICYLGCSPEAAISDLRLDIYKKALIKNDLEFSDKNVYICNETREDYFAALEYFTSGNSIPDAIICYNDRLASNLIIAAEEKGYRIPEDFGVSGCDNSAAGQNMIPALTTISSPVYELGQIAVENLHNLIKGRELSNTAVFAKVIYGGTCGCSYRSDKKIHLYSHALNNQIADLEKSIIMSSKMASAFSTVDNIEDGLDFIAEFAGEIENCTGFYLALSSEWNNLSDRILALTDSSEYLDANNIHNASDDMTLYLAVQNGKRLPGCTFKNNVLLPDFIMSESEDARIVSPVYNHDNSYGYIVMTFDNNRINYPFKLIQWLVNVSSLLNNIRNRKRINAMTSHLEDIYMRDELTGFYNKAGYEYYKKKLISKAPSLGKATELAITINNLDTINETYGYDEGNFALQILGQAISQSTDDSVVTGRIRGTEFAMIIQDSQDDMLVETVIKGIHSYLDNYANLSSKEYKITANILKR
ncbi:GGDEF domain-containing protein [Butyrivibrio sp. JL13D10]|uniref:substrate-binding and GGDEF domain-containing protein n=1 Tax=Butyrivibrio sp. JL13D10 TaxID=3236815 RepID=UPI0038B46BC1